MSAIERPPFDARDAATAEAYLRGRGASSFDPFADPLAHEDLIFTTSLAGARLMMAESFTTRRAGSQPFRGYPVFVERPTANAFAIERDGLQIYGIDVGLAVAAHELSLFVFSQASLFTEIGAAAAEASPMLPPNAQLSFWMADQLRAGMQPGRPAGLELVPRDPARQLASSFLTQLLLRFVWLHELFHGLNGHTGLLAAQGIATPLADMPSDPPLTAIEIERDDAADARKGLLNLMEFDADRTALWASIRMQQTDSEPITGLAAWPRLQRLKLAVFAGVLMTFLFDQAARRYGSGNTHPLAYHRLHNLVRTLASNLAADDDQVRQAFHAVIAELRALEDRSPFSISTAQLIQDLRSPELQGLFDQVEGILTDVRASFAPFSYGHPARS